MKHSWRSVEVRRALPVLLLGGLSVGTGLVGAFGLAGLGAPEPTAERARAPETAAREERVFSRRVSPIVSSRTTEPTPPEGLPALAGLPILLARRAELPSEAVSPASGEPTLAPEALAQATATAQHPQPGRAPLSDARIAELLRLGSDFFGISSSQSAGERRSSFPELVPVTFDDRGAMASVHEAMLQLDPQAVPQLRALLAGGGQEDLTDTGPFVEFVRGMDGQSWSAIRSACVRSVFFGDSVTR
jgi:hypothetical protein